MPSKVNAITRTYWEPEFYDAFANGFGIAHVSGLHPQQSNANPGLGGLVAQTIQPFAEGLGTIFPLVSKKLNHAENSHIVA